MKKISTVLFVSGAICFSIFLLHLIITGNAVYGDGRYYYSTTRSLIVDGNLEYSNEYSYYGITEFKTPSGYLANKYAPGASIFWTPAFFITHLFISLLKSVGLNIQNNGFSLPYQITSGLTTIIITMIGLYFLYQTLVCYFSQRISLFAVLITLFATNLFYYSAFDVINSHGISFAFSSLYFYLLLNKSLPKKWFFAGLLIGIVTLIRTQDAILAVPGIIILVSQKKSVVAKLKSFILFVLGSLITFIPQVYFWLRIYGTLYKSPYLNEIEGFAFLKPQVFGVLFNSNTGLVVWTPIVFLGILGLFFINNLKIRNLLFFTTLAEFYLIASWSSWNQGGSFGTRMLISVLPLIAFGFCWLINNLKDIKRAVVFLLISAIINISLITTFLITH